MPSKRWVEEVKKFSFRFVADGPDIVSADQAAKLLSRQHAAVVRLVKRQTPPACMRIGYQHGYSDARRDILAALAKEKGGKP